MILKPTAFKPETTGTLERLFAQLVNRSFDDLQVNLEIRDYVVDLLCRFARTDALYRIRDPRGRRIETVVELLIERDRLAQDSYGSERERDVQRHTGDYALFMSGIFRAYVERHGFLHFYMEMGPRAYRETARIQRELHAPDAERFDALARDFELISGAVDYMRKVYFGNAVMHGEMGEVARRFSMWS